MDVLARLDIAQVVVDIADDLDYFVDVDRFGFGLHVAAALGVEEFRLAVQVLDADIFTRYEVLLFPLFDLDLLAVEIGARPGAVCR